MNNKSGLIGIVIAVSILLLACSNQVNRDSDQNENIEHNSKQIFTVQILGINDYHGQVKLRDTRGGMVQLIRHLSHKISSTNEHSFILHAGDHVGASPAESALLQDEPAIDVLNLLNNYCKTLQNNPCSVIGAAGNHEFDEGSDELRRLLEGGNHRNGPFIHPQWQGANYVTLGANVLDKNTLQPILPPYVVHKVNDVPIGFIGITLDITPELVVPGIVENLVFENQAETVAKLVNELTQQGVESIIVIVHDGSSDDYYDGPTQENSGIILDSRFGRFVQALPDEVDVIVSGHSHRFTNAYVSNDNGKKFLVTQAFSSGRAYSDISITISRATKDIIASSAEIIMTEASSELSLDKNTELLLDKVVKLEQSSIEFAKSLTEKVVGRYIATPDDIPLGQFIADSHRFVLKSDLAIMNRGGVRASLSEGEVTWGELFAIQPFSNPLVVRKYSKQQLESLLLENHFFSSNLQKNDNGDFLINGQTLRQGKFYTLGGNAFILNSKDFNQGEIVGIYGLDIDATVEYIKQLEQPFSLAKFTEKTL